MVGACLCAHCVPLSWCTQWRIAASCVLPNWTFKSFTLPKSQVALIIGYFDFVACVCFWIAIIWLRRKEDIEVQRNAAWLALVSSIAMLTPVRID